MTTAKEHHKTARALLLRHLDMHPGQVVSADLDPAEVGIVGDTSHAEGGDSYHLGKDQIRTSGHRYSVDESTRDTSGLNNYASGVDVGYFKVTTRRGTFDLPYFSRWLVALCKAWDPDTADLREVIYSPDGQVVRRWDREARRTSGDTSHLFHSHLSEYRDATGIRMVRLATRFLQHIGLIPEEDDMTKAEFLSYLKDPEVRRELCAAVMNTDGVIPAPGNPKPGTNPDGTPINTHWGAGSYLQNTYGAAVNARTYAAAGRDAASALGPYVRAEAAEVPPTAEQNAAAVLDALAQADRPDAEVAAALKAALGDRAAEIGRLLTT